MRFSRMHINLALFFAVMAGGLTAVAQNAPSLLWVPNSSVKLEQLIGDVDWATGSNTTSQTISRFNIEGTDLGCSFASGTNLIFHQPWPLVDDV